MKAIQMKEFGGPEVLKYTEVPEPIPNKNEVLIKLYAAGVNPNETYIRTGTYSIVPELPYVPGFDGAGIVEALGEGVKDLKVGDRVFVAALISNRNTGTYAEKVVCDEKAVHKLPDNIPFKEGAALGIPALTAYRALFIRGKLKSGEIVLIHGASGGVGLLAVQMAKAAGAKVIGTASTEEGRKAIKALGADYVINHVKEDSIKEVLSLTENKGPNLIIEFLANVNLETDLKIIAKGGAIIVVGNRGSLDFNPRLAMGKEADIRGMILSNSTNEEYKESLEKLKEFLEKGLIHPLLGYEVKLEEAKEAHKLVSDKKGAGKIILSINNYKKGSQIW